MKINKMNIIKAMIIGKLNMVQKMTLEWKLNKGIKWNL